MLLDTGRLNGFFQTENLGAINQREKESMRNDLIVLWNIEPS